MDDIQVSATKAANIARNTERDELITTRQYFIVDIATIMDDQVTRLKAQLDETTLTVMYNFTENVTKRMTDLCTDVVTLTRDIVRVFQHLCLTAPPPL